MSVQHPKRDFLKAAGALHAHPERVKAVLFETHRFFDPLDKVQVKYEMLRANVVEGESVVRVCEAFGFSRETFYTTLHAFEEFGWLGLADERRGRRGPVKLTDEVVRWVHTVERAEPHLSGREIAEMVAKEYGIVVHRRTIERLLAGGGKKNF
jgi:transposase